MIKNVFILTILALSSFFLTGLLWADDVIKEGKWQITSSIDPKAQPDVITRCVTNANPIPDITKYAKEFDGCVPPKIQRSGSTVDYSETCSGQTGQISLKGHVEFTGESMKGQASLNTSINNYGSSVQTHLTGKYVGPC